MVEIQSQTIEVTARPRKGVDVLVAGAGIAGISAAVAAARQGSKTMLVESYGVLGGTATVCGVGAFCGETRGQGEVFDDITSRLEELDAIQPYRPYPSGGARKFDHEVLPIVLQELVEEAEVQLILHAQAVWPILQPKGVSSILVNTTSGLEAIPSKVVVDATGQADIVYRAGYPTSSGRPGDGATLPMSMMFFLRDIGRKVRPLSPPGSVHYESEEDLPMVSVWEEPDGKLGIKVKVAGYNVTDSSQFTEAEIIARRRAFGVAEYLQRTRFQNHKFDYAAVQIGVREGRRAVGEYVLTVGDLRAGRKFEDVIARGVYPLDAHDPLRDDRTYILEDRVVPPYHVPYRSLIPRGAKNLLVAGRCISADQLALSSARVMTTSSMTGQAAGIAASMAARDGRDVGGIDVGSLQRELLRHGAKW